MSHTETLVAFGWCCQSAHSSDEVTYEYEPKSTVQVCPCCKQTLPAPAHRQRIMICKRTEREIPPKYWFMPPLVVTGVPDEPVPREEVAHENVDLTG